MSAIQNHTLYVVGSGVDMLQTFTGAVAARCAARGGDASFCLIGAFSFLRSSFCLIFSISRIMFSLADQRPPRLGLLTLVAGAAASRLPWLDASPAAYL